jgi:hypothetical protein
MTAWEHTHTTMTVIASPVDWLQPGDEYDRGTIADWLEWGEIPAGAVLRNGRDWTVTRGPHGLVLEADGERLTADGVRGLRLRRRATTMHLDVLRAVRDLSAETGQPPTYREIAARVGCVISLVKYHVHMMCAEGLLDREPYHRRSLWLTEAGERLAQGGAE